MTYHYFVVGHHVGRRVSHGHEDAVHDDAQHDELSRVGARVEGEGSVARAES